MLYTIVVYTLLYIIFLCIHSYIISIILGLSEKANENGKLSYIWNESSMEEKTLLVIVLIPYIPIVVLAATYDFITKLIRKK